MKKFNKRGTIVWACVSVFLAALFITITILANGILEPILQTVLGNKKPALDDSVNAIYTSDYNSKAESKEAGDKLNVEIAQEGFTLLENYNVLPMETPETEGSSVTEKPKVSVFGKNSTNLVLGGSGSGGIGSESAKTIFDGLTAGGYEYNPVLKAFYESDASGEGRSSSPTLTAGSSSSPTLKIGETPIANYTQEVIDSYASYNDLALVVVSRLGGESWDLPRVQDTTSGGIEGSHYLQLDDNEYALLDEVTARFDKVIVVLNTLTSFQCDFMDEYNNSADKRIDGLLWIGGPGSTGAEAIGSVLNGNVNPSGKTVDLYSKDFTKDPTWINFGDGSQATADGSANVEFEGANANKMIIYDESIYVGYRYYETRAYEEKLENPSSKWYEQNVRYPYGYGLSYTTFTQEITEVSGSLTDLDSSVEITVEVTNTGAVAGKDVVQLYVNTPYTFGGIEKPYVQLVDFAKTPVLAAGASWSVTFEVAAYDLASYDYNDANANGIKGYELEEGDYNFIVSANSHVDAYAYDATTFALEQDLYFENDPVTDVKVENLFTDNEDLFNDADYRIDNNNVVSESGMEVTRKGMSRTDFEGTFPKASTKDERAVMENAEGVTEFERLTDYSHNNTAIADIVAEKGMPTTGAENEITIRDLIGKDYDDDLWNELLDKLTFQEMKDLANKGAFQTVDIESIDKNLTYDSDGPIGFVNFQPGLSSHYDDNTTFACEIVIGSTWNKDLAYRMGRIVGDNAVWGDYDDSGLPYSGWYAPAINLHRSPFSGRNFEYYSEDPVLSGKMAVNVINGAATKGVYTDLKHFALNDQETNRSGVATFCTEQAMREVYFKAFEIAVKGDDVIAETAAEQGVTEYKGTMGVMSSFNRIGLKWTGGDYRLLNNVLRSEWGFRGLVICDYKSGEVFMDAKQMLYAGNDLILASVESLMWLNPDPTSAEDVTVLRTAAHNILYAVANSNSVNVKVVGYQTEWWKTMIIVLDCVVAAAIVAWGFFAIKKSGK
ncbi:MAG: hypothetical protein E7370_03065 [Clostridiales bacterium]|nr:hypothetical protein [Clostridiales bacterium]